MGPADTARMQEFLILDRYVDTIQPDAILWQYCVNDFINNDNALERLSHINNNGWIRPYWRDGSIQLLSPKESSIQVRDWINRTAAFILRRHQAGSTPRRQHAGYGRGGY